MGYDFTIGEAIPNIASPKDIDTGMDRAELRWEAEIMRDPTMPQEWNKYSCTYTWWSECMTRVGLGDLLVTKARYEPPPALIPSHPGAARLTPGHLERFKVAQGIAVALANGRECERKDLLDWLVAWTEWALVNCKVPTLANR